MLFDLRGRGRQRTVRMIYLGLALLMGVGLVGFGVGGGLGGGGIVDALKSNGNGAAPTSFTDRVKADQRRTTLAPTDPAAWAALTRDQFLVAGQGDNYDNATSQFTTKGKDQLAQVKVSWDRYLTLTPKPDADLANQMVQVLGPGGINQPAAAVQALQIVIAARPPSSTLFANLAAFSYLAGNSRQGDLAAGKAVALAPAAQQASLRTQLQTLKKQGTGGAAGGATGASTTPAAASGTTTVAPTPTTTTGKSAKH